MTSKLPLDIPYTIGFCICGDEVLMLHRKFPPNQDLWNGVGGKIHAGETPDEAIRRELMEESALDASHAESIQYVGIVTWHVISGEKKRHQGMYAYIIRFTDPIAWSSKDSDEGLLEWKKLAWVIDTDNHEVVDNIPYFLPTMLETSEPLIYECVYKDGILDDFTIHPHENKHPS